MHRLPRLLLAIVLISPLVVSVQSAGADLNDVAKALGASTVKSIQYTAIGGVNAVFGSRKANGAAFGVASTGGRSRCVLVPM